MGSNTGEVLLLDPLILQTPFHSIMLQLLIFMFITALIFLFACHTILSIMTLIIMLVVSPNCVMTPQLIPCDKLYFPGVVSFHYTGDKCGIFITIHGPATTD